MGTEGYPFTGLRAEARESGVVVDGLRTYPRGTRTRAASAAAASARRTGGAARRGTPAGSESRRKIGSPDGTVGHDCHGRGGQIPPYLSIAKSMRA